VRNLPVKKKKAIAIGAARRSVRGGELGTARGAAGCGARRPVTRFPRSTTS